MKKSAPILLIISIALLFANCSKNEEENLSVEKGTVNIRLYHTVDGKAFEPDTLLYTNSSGTRYSISSLRYYLSSLCLTDDNGKKRTVNATCYVDATQDTVIQFSGIPEGHYVQLSFYIGLDEAHNKSGTLPLSIENIDMVWPTEMGGGYHFLKMEGYFMDGQNHAAGYAIHLGKNGMYIKHNTIICCMPVSKDKAASVELEMNINELFTHPYDYDFIKDGNYIMSNSQLMKLIRDNGKDVFKLH